MLNQVDLFDNRLETVAFKNVFENLFNFLEVQKFLLRENAYEVWALADYLYSRVPTASTMPLQIWRQSFNEVIDAFRLSGTIETYLTMLYSFFGDDTLIEFSVPSPATLVIDITLSGEVGDKARKHEWADNFANDIINNDFDNIVFYQILNILTGQDLAEVLKATVPVGIQVSFNIIGG